MGKRTKHVPIRTCVGCRQTLPKKTLIRIVKTPDGIQVDPSGKIPGRGVYLHSIRECWNQGLKGAVSHALKTKLSEEDIDHMKTFMLTIPEEQAN